MANRPPNKVAIPRLPKDHSARDPDPNYPQDKRDDKGRVEKACDNCRKRKVGCSGEHPRCFRCAQQHITCVYASARKDRLKESDHQNEKFVTLLRDLRLRVDEEDRQKIDAALGQTSHIAGSSIAPSSVYTLNAHGKRSRSGSQLGFQEHSQANSPSAAKSSPRDKNEAEVAGSVGSNENLDIVDEDLLRNREARAIGFMGQNSEMQWIRSLKNSMEKSRNNNLGAPAHDPYGPPGDTQQDADKRSAAMHTRRESSNLRESLHVTDSTFYLDAENIELEHDIDVDPDELPPPHIAELLFDSYLHTVHSSFPIVSKSYVEQFQHWNNSRHTVPARWKAIANLIFAIGACFSHLILAPWRADERDHILYMTRAVKILNLDKAAIFLSLPDISLIQATGLLSLYYLAIGHVSRAWVMIGIALRFSLAVGLHLRNEDPNARTADKESLVRLWWSLHAVESLLCSIIGRTCVISDKECTVPAPQILPEEQMGDNVPPQLLDPDRRGNQTPTGPSIASLSKQPDKRNTEQPTRKSFLGTRIRIGLILQKALYKLYSPHTATSSWEDIQRHITSLKRELDEHSVAAIPDEDFGVDHANGDPVIRRERLLLGFHYHSTRLIITRPCLCRIDERIRAQTNRSARFNTDNAEACVKSAQSLTRLLPDDPDPQFIYHLGPWWSIVHHIMQAMAVFLLEVSFSGDHMAKDAEDIPTSIRKLVKWLRMLSFSNPVAQRAYMITIDIIKTGAGRVNIDISNILEDDVAGPPTFTYPPPSEVPDFASFTNPAADPTSAWEPPAVTYSNLNVTPALQFGDSMGAHVGDPFYPPSGEHLTMPMMGGYPSDDAFMLDPGIQLPPAFGNPFVSSFDQGGLFTGPFTAAETSSMTEAWNTYPNYSGDDKQQSAESP